MSAKEKLTALEEQARLAEKVQSDQEEAQKKQQHQQEAEQVRIGLEQHLEQERLYKLGLPRAKREQVRLFKELKAVGLIDALTDITGRRFFAPRVPVPHADPSKPFKIHWPPSKEEIHERLDRYGWRVNIVDPIMQPDGTWVRGILDLAISKSHQDLVGHRTDIVRVERVAIHYTKTHNLEIAGTETTFSDTINPTNPTQEQTEALETAIALAFYKPKVEDHSWYAKLQTKKKEAIDQLKIHYGDILGEAMGNFIYSRGSEESAQRTATLAREVVILLGGTADDRIRAIEGLLKATKGYFINRLEPVATSARRSEIEHMRF